MSAISVARSLRFGYFFLTKGLCVLLPARTARSSCSEYPSPQGLQADALFLVFVPQRQPALSGDGIAGSLQKRQQRVEVLWLLFKRRVYRHAQKIAVGELVVTAAPFVVAQPCLCGFSTTDSRCSAQIRSDSLRTAR